MPFASSCARIAPLVMAAALLSRSALADDPKPAPPDTPPPAAAAPPPAAPAAPPPAAPAAPPPAAPAAPAAPPAPSASKGGDLGLLIGGVLMVAFGAPSLVAGSVKAATCHASTQGCAQQTDGIVALTLGGAALLAGGIVTTIAGVRPPAGKSATRWAPAVALGPTGGSLRWTF
jgi:hypothetical protein